MNELTGYTIDEEELSKLDEASRLISTIRKETTKAIEARDNGQLGDAVDSSEMVEKVAGFTTAALQEFTFMKLENVETLKNEIDLQANRMITVSGIILLLSILVSIVIMIKMYQ